MSRITDEKRQNTKDAILEVAEKLFSQRGYHNTQVMDIVREVGISAGTFYKHFKDKRDLFARITSLSFSELRSRLRELRLPVDIWDRNDRTAKLKESFGAYFDYIKNHQQQYLILFRRSTGVDDELDSDVWSYYSDITRDIADDIQAWQDMGVIEGINPHAMACAVVGMTMYVGRTYLMDDSFSRDEAIEILTSMSHLTFESHLTEAGRGALNEIETSHTRGRR